MQDHDSSYRKLFSSPQMIRDLFSGFVGEDWVKELNFDTMEAVETSFVSDSFKKREADLPPAVACPRYFPSPFTTGWCRGMRQHN
jgi:hypothetical protein